MGKTLGINKNRLKNVENNLDDLKDKYEESKAEFEKHLKFHIKEDLQKKRFEGSDKYLYTYEDIAKRHNVTKYFVEKVVAENDLQRGKK